MRTLRRVVAAHLTLAGVALGQPDSREQEMKEAVERITPVREKADTLLIEGRPDEANALILAIYPETGRTPVQSLMLGNVLFKQSPAQAYQLHKAAAAAMPDFADALLEWAIDQQHAKEYAGAAGTFSAFSALNPDYAPALGLAAECQLRLGNPAGAVALWQKSEAAKTGTLDEFETLVCEVHGPFGQETERIRLLHLAEGGDARAAEGLILQDSAWEFDWWNKEPNKSRLKHDLTLVKKTFPNPDQGLSAALCVAAIKSQSTTGKAAAVVLKKYGFLLDPGGTVPESGRAVSQMLAAVLDHELLTADQARSKFGEQILAVAQKTNDAAAYNAAAHLFLGTDRLPEIDQAGWDAAHDPRFAASRLEGLMQVHKLTIDDPLVVRAVKEFPDDPYVAGIVLELARAAGKPLEPYLVAAIEAEYMHLSALVNGYADAERPSARAIRVYFKELATLQPGASPAKR